MSLRSKMGTSLVVQWLTICLPMHGTGVRSLVWELRSHMTHSQKKEKRYQKRSEMKEEEIEPCLTFRKLLKKSQSKPLL